MPKGEKIDDLRQVAERLLKKKVIETSDEEYEKLIKKLVEEGQPLYADITKPMFFEIFKNRVEDMSKEDLVKFIHNF